MEQVGSLRTERKFKKTEIGDIPVDWEVSIVKNHAVVITKGTTPTTYGHSYTKEGVLFLRVENVGEQGQFVLGKVKYISEETDKFLSSSRLQSGDILFSIAGTLGRVAVVPDVLLPANINQALALIRFKNKNLDRQYLKYVLQSGLIKAQVNLMVAQLAQHSLKLQQIRDLKFPLPSKSEQKKITEILSAIDETIEKNREIIEKTKELKKGLMQELHTRGIGHKKFKKTEIGKIPVDWKIVKIKDIMSINLGKSLSANKREGNLYPVYGSNRIVGYHKDFLVEGPGIIMGRKGTVGSVTWSDTSFWPLDTTYYIITDISKCNLKWLYYQLCKLNYNQINTAVSLSTLSKDFILNSKIILPPYPEQKIFAQILSAVDISIEKEIVNKDKLINFRKEMMKVLFKGKIRVNG